MDIKVSTSSIIEKLMGDTPEKIETNLKKLVKDFKLYKSGCTLAIFGKDAPYDHMNTPRSVLDENVQHVHMIKIGEIFPRWKRQDQKTSEVHLVYCQAAMDDDHYYLITILEPNAHDLAKDGLIMRNIGDIAAKFRLKN